MPDKNHEKKSISRSLFWTMRILYGKK